MTAIPQQQFTQADLTKWYELQAQIAKMKVEEMALRNRIFAGAFPSPEEGTNNYALPDGYVLKGKHTINRKVDEAALVLLQPQLQERKIQVDNLVKRNPELSVSAYRKLNDDDRKFFDQALIIKDGAPALEIVKPKRG